MRAALFDDRRIAAIEARVNAAPHGPWQAMLEGRDHSSGSSCILTPTGGIDLDGASDRDIEFIANACEDIPYLIAEIRYLAGVLQPKKQDGLH